MKFLSPTTDIAFKKLFGDREKPELTISFLNSVLERQDGALITQVTINDNANIPDTLDKKISFVDINCTDQAGKRYIIEVQVIDEKNFIERSQFYTAFFLARQLDKRENYKKLLPVIFIGVVCYDLFQSSHYLTHHYIAESTTGIQTFKHLEFHFIETSKFNKNLDELTIDADKWTYLLKHAHEMQQIPAQLQNEPEFLEAFHILERGGWTESEFQMYLTELDLWRREQDRHQAMLELGREQGREQGLAEGELTKARSVAIKLLRAGIDIKTIANSTDLSSEEIEILKQDT